MSEIEKTNAFIDQLRRKENELCNRVMLLNNQIPIEIARFQTMGIENDCKIIELEPTYLDKNPYFNNIHIEDWKVGNVYLDKKDFYRAGITYSFDSRKRNPETLTTIYKYCYFPTHVNYPALGTIFPETKWMGVEPPEINTFAPFIKEAKGKVLLMGCGLGYLAYMLSLKKEIEEVTIVELDRDVIEMFVRYLKPQMNNKINIIHGDAIQFLEETDISMYQYCSVDIWHDAMEMFPIYLKCLLLEQKHPKTKFHYWLEEDLHTTMETAWIELLKNSINQKNPAKNSEIFTEILQMQSIETIDDVRKFIMADKRPIITDWALKNPDKASNHEDLAKTLLKIQTKF